MTTETTTEKTHAEQNAEGHAESILELYQAYTALDEGAETATAEGDEFTDADEVRERVQESALSVEVRGAWYTPGDEDGAKPTEYQVLLSTGGPALRIVGDLNGYSEPDGEARLQHQDWGTPWTDYTPDVAEDDEWEDALAWFVGCFYFGQ